MEGWRLLASAAVTLQSLKSLVESFFRFASESGFSGIAGLAFPRALEHG
jgi:hypothetical protein